MPWLQLVETVGVRQVEHIPRSSSGPDRGSGLESGFLFGNAASYGAWSLHGAVWAFDGNYSDPDFNILVSEEGA